MLQRGPLVLRDERSETAASDSTEGLGFSADEGGSLRGLFDEAVDPQSGLDPDGSGSGRLKPLDRGLSRLRGGLTWTPELVLEDPPRISFWWPLPAEQEPYSIKPVEEMCLAA